MDERIFCFVVVDDEEVTRKLVLDILASEFPNSSFYSFPDGLEAKNWLVENSDKKNLIIITDLEMPKLSGEDLVEFIKGDTKLQNTPALMVSGYSKIKEVAEELWGCRFLKKPFKLAEFLDIIREFTKEK